MYFTNGISGYFIDAILRGTVVSRCDHSFKSNASIKMHFIFKKMPLLSLVFNLMA